MIDIRTHNAAIDTIERIIDSNSLRETVEMLAEICSAKADHIRENWQDEALAAAWDKEAARLLNVAGHVSYKL